MSNKYWVNDDGYIMYNKGDKQIIVCGMYPEHVQALTKIIGSYDDLLAACKAAFDYLPDPESSLELREKLYNAIYKAER